MPPVVPAADVSSDRETETDTATCDILNLNFYYQNVQGLRTITNKFFLASSSCDFDVIMLTETWLLPTISSLELFTSSFTVFRRDRYQTGIRKGGGVLIAVNTALECELVDIPNPNAIEFVAVCVIVNDRRFFCYCGYLVPESPLETYNSHLVAIKFLADLAGFEDTMVFSGDFKLPGLVWKPSDTHTVEQLPIAVSSDQELCTVDGMFDLGFHQINHVCNSRGSLLDLIYCTNIDDVDVVRSPSPLRSENMNHYAVGFTIGCANECSLRVADSGIETFDFKKEHFLCMHRLEPRLQSL